MRYFLAALLAVATLAPPARAQDTTAIKRYLTHDSVDVVDSIGRDRSAPQYSKRAQARVMARQDSIRAAMRAKQDTATPPTPPAPAVSTVEIQSPGDSVLVGKSLQLFGVPKDKNGVTLATPVAWSAGPASIGTVSGTGLLTGVANGVVTVVARADTVTKSKAFTVYTATVPDTTTPAPPTGTVAELPRNAEVSDSMPTTTSSTRVPAGSNLQTAINNATCGTTLLLDPGSVFTGNYNIPGRGPNCWLVIRTMLMTRPTGRMTPSKAAALKLARLATPSYTPLISTLAGASGLYLSELEMTVAPGVATINMLLDFRNDPSRIVITDNWIHGTPTLDGRRGATMNARDWAITRNWFDDWHSNNSDSQSVICYDFCQRGRIEDNELRAGHEVVMFGGADPSDSSRTPADFIIRDNHITRPLAWKGKWQVKNLVETKNVRRLLIEGNVIENNWADAQTGFAVVLKSENQQGTAPWTSTSDVTMRQNLVQCVGNWLNVSGHGSNSTPVIVSSRFTIYQNVIRNVNTTDCNATGIAVQVLSEMTDLNLAQNTILNSGSSNTLITFDGTPTVRLVVRNNVGYHGSYGVKGAGTNDGATTLAKFAPGSVFTGNAIINGGNCTQYPAGNTCPTTVPSAPGADVAAVQARVANVVVADPSLLRPRVARPDQLKYKWTPTAPEDRVDSEEWRNSPTRKPERGIDP
jgi:hypothetical protein